ncbi:uncharacterized protein LOC8068096 [Sorghum bicolor]|uniref:uncharacterized protein LOC8068096 n=1 Tax=Sorghum bicolor TaxID=4558 RepID=UPI000B425A2C|nr:uncharacterized protein LOC8068096 [Sorghum bicolor]|eukprot:XP_021321780.1 uncharacterized protein LOC8068096 [Sorghum bicolor]
MQSFHPGETRARCFQSIGNRVKRSETSAVAFHFIPDPPRCRPESTPFSRVKNTAPPVEGAHRRPLPVVATRRRPKGTRHRRCDPPSAAPRRCDPILAAVRHGSAGKPQRPGILTARGSSEASRWREGAAGRGRSSATRASQWREGAAARHGFAAGRGFSAPRIRQWREGAPIQTWVEEALHSGATSSSSDAAIDFFLSCWDWRPWCAHFIPSCSDDIVPARASARSRMGGHVPKFSCSTWKPTQLRMGAIVEVISGFCRVRSKDEATMSIQCVLVYGFN